MLKRKRKRMSELQKHRRCSFERLEERTVLSATALSGLSSLIPSDDVAEHARHIDLAGNEYHVLPSAVNHAESTGAEGGAQSADAPVPLANTFQLHSNPGAAHTIFLDFDGHTTSGTSWNSSFNGGADIVTGAYSFSGDSSFSDAELERIQYIWQRVAEDFMPFDVNVTTQDPGAANLANSGGADTQWGIRVVVGGDGSWYGSAGGVAYVGSFDFNSDTPVFAFEDNLGNGNEKYTAEAISHEVGHALGLRHDGRFSPSESYYQGHGSGATGWASIMGVGYYKELTQWSQGEYLSANNTEDDLAIITGNNGFGYRADDHGNAASTATSLLVTGNALSGAGIIERTSDVDVFSFVTDAGTLTLDVAPFERGPNLDVAVELYDFAGALVASANPVDALGASLNISAAAGEYFVHVSGVGKGDPLGDGYTDYGSLGQFTISGTIVESTADSVSIAANDAVKPEGDTGSTEFVFTVSRTGDLSGATNVEFNVTGSGGNPASGDDFVGGVFPSGTITFAAGESSKQITIAVKGDENSELDESFSVTLSNPANGTQITTGTANGLIQNDDALSGITVTPTSGLVTTESGGTAAFTVVLDAKPTADVVISVTSLDTSEGTLDTTSLTFTADNWGTAQSVTVIGVDDSIKDRNVQYTVELGTVQSLDSSYDGMNPSDVFVTNQDNDKGGGGGRGGGGNEGGGKGRPKKSGPHGVPVIHNSLFEISARQATVEANRGRVAFFGQFQLHSGAQYANTSRGALAVHSGAPDALRSEVHVAPDSNRDASSRRTSVDSNSGVDSYFAELEDRLSNLDDIAAEPLDSDATLAAVDAVFCEL